MVLFHFLVVGYWNFLVRQILPHFALLVNKHHDIQRPHYQEVVDNDKVQECFIHHHRSFTSSTPDGVDPNNGRFDGLAAPTSLVVVG